MLYIYVITFFSVDTALEIVLTCKQYSITAEEIIRSGNNFSFKSRFLSKEIFATDAAITYLCWYVYRGEKDRVCSGAGTFLKICRKECPDNLMDTEE